VQDPIYGFELEGRKWRLQELAPLDETRRVKVSTNRVRFRADDEPSATFEYQAMEDHWGWSFQVCSATGWDQFHDPLLTLHSLAEFLNNNHPPVMNIHRA
jgi:hypothetical protein